MRSIRNRAKKSKGSGAKVDFLLASVRVKGHVHRFLAGRLSIIHSCANIRASDEPTLQRGRPTGRSNFSHGLYRLCAARVFMSLKIAPITRPSEDNRPALPIPCSLLWPICFPFSRRERAESDGVTRRKESLNTEHADLW